MFLLSWTSPTAGPRCSPRLPFSCATAPCPTALPLRRIPHTPAPARGGGVLPQRPADTPGDEGGARNDWTGSGSADPAAPRDGRPWVGSAAARGAEPPLSAVLDPPCAPGGLRLGCRPHPALHRTVVSPPPPGRATPCPPLPRQGCGAAPPPPARQTALAERDQHKTLQHREFRHPKNLRGAGSVILEPASKLTAGQRGSGSAPAGTGGLGWGHPEVFPGRWIYGRSLCAPGVGGH